MTSEWPCIEAVIIPSGVSGEVLLTGAAEFVTGAILDLDLEIDHFVREVGEDRTGVTCVGLEMSDETVEVIRLRVLRALTALVDRVPELAGWDPRVRIVETPRDNGDELCAAEDFDAEAGRLLPSGEELADSLTQEIRYEGSIYDYARLFRAMPIEDLSTEELASLNIQERNEALRRRRSCPSNGTPDSRAVPD